MELQLREGADAVLDAAFALYEANDWRAYTRDPAALRRALAGSTWVVSAWEGERLVGLARCVSDDVSIVYLQDILVHPERHGQGCGRRLLRAALDRFSHVRQFVLLTDDRPQQLAFYAAMGLHDIGTLTRVRLHAFVRIEGVELE